MKRSKQQLEAAYEAAYITSGELAGLTQDEIMARSREQLDIHTEAEENGIDLSDLYARLDPEAGQDKPWWKIW